VSTRPVDIILRRIFQIEKYFVFAESSCSHEDFAWTLPFPGVYAFSGTHLPLPPSPPPPPLAPRFPRENALLVQHVIVQQVFFKYDSILRQRRMSSSLCLMYSEIYDTIHEIEREILSSFDLLRQNSYK
jgi:hypothetical protein